MRTKIREFILYNKWPFRVVFAITCAAIMFCVYLIVKGINCIVYH